MLNRSTAGGVSYRLSLFDAEPDGSFDFIVLLRRIGLAAADAATAVLAMGGGVLPLGDLPLAVRIASLGGADARFGVAVDIPADRQFVIFDSADDRFPLEVIDDWLDDPAITPATVGDRGLEMYVLTIPAAGEPRIEPRVILRGLGMRIDKAGGSKLIDLGVTIRSVGVHGYLDKDFTNEDVRVGGRLELDQFGIPLGDAGGNPVASNLMAPSSDAGDATTLAPGVQPVGSDRLQARRIGHRSGGPRRPRQRALVVADPARVRAALCGAGRTGHRADCRPRDHLDPGRRRRLGRRADRPGRRPRGDHPLGHPV